MNTSCYLGSRLWKKTKRFWTERPGKHYTFSVLLHLIWTNKIYFFYVIKANLLLINFKMCFDESIFLQITVSNGWLWSHVKFFAVTSISQFLDLLDVKRLCVLFLFTPKIVLLISYLAQFFIAEFSLNL